MKQVVFYLKPFTFLPAIIMMYLILGFSSQDGPSSSSMSYEITYKIVETGSNLFHLDYTPQEIAEHTERIHGLVRKFGHVSEYAALAILLTIPLFLYGFHRWWLVIVTLIFCAIFGCGDEYYQSFIDGRSPQLTDVGIDSLGALAGILLTQIFGWLIRHTVLRGHYKKQWAARHPVPAADESDSYISRKPQKKIPELHDPYDIPFDASHDQPYQNYYNDPYNNPPHQYRPNKKDYYPESDDYAESSSSDRLSEDLSFKNLIHNLKKK